jgi:hypothetical protein
MIARTAFTQLQHSAILLMGTVAGMSILYLAPPGLALFGTGLARTLGAAAWVLMAATYAPILRFYGQALVWTPALPLVAAFYTVCTIRSAVEYWQGRGGDWKGRVQDHPGTAQ